MHTRVGYVCDFLDIQSGDEVIIPDFTFVSTVNAFVLRGAKPVFIDVRADTLNLDESKLEALITPRTKVIAPVHYAGVGCEMDKITALAYQHGIAIVEDNAHGLFGKYKGKYLGTFGALAVNRSMRRRTSAAVRRRVADQ